jgi:hypothetical protein
VLFVLDDVVGNLVGHLLFRRPVEKVVSEKRLQRGWVDSAARLTGGTAAGMSKRWRGGLIAAVDGQLAWRTAPLLPFRAQVLLPMQVSVIQESDDRPTGQGAWGLPANLHLVRLTGPIWALDLGVRDAMREPLIGLLQTGRL